MTVASGNNNAPEWYKRGNAFAPAELNRFPTGSYRSAFKLAVDPSSSADARRNSSVDRISLALVSLCHMGRPIWNIRKRSGGNRRWAALVGGKLVGRAMKRHRRHRLGIPTIPGYRLRGRHRSHGRDPVGKFARQLKRETMVPLVLSMTENTRKPPG